MGPQQPISCVILMEECSRRPKKARNQGRALWSMQASREGLVGAGPSGSCFATPMDMAVSAPKGSVDGPSNPLAASQLLARALFPPSARRAACLGGFLHPNLSSVLVSSYNENLFQIK